MVGGVSTPSAFERAVGVARGRSIAGCNIPLATLVVNQGYRYLSIGFETSYSMLEDLYSRQYPFCGSQSHPLSAVVIVPTQLFGSSPPDSDNQIQK